MNFDIGPMQATTSPLALLAGPQVVAPSEEFAVLMDLGAPPPKTNRPVENANTAQTLDTSGVLKSSEIAAANLPDANPAIAQADALVFALSSDAKSSRMLAKSPEAFVSMKGDNILTPAPTVLAFDEPSSRLTPLPPEALDDEAEDQSETDDRREETVDDESASRVALAEPNVPVLAAIQVSSSPTPFPGYADVQDETTFETMTSPAPAIAKLETDDQREEAIESESDSRVSAAEQGAPMLAAIQVSPIPTPFQGHPVALDETTFEATTSPAPANAAREATPPATSEGNELDIGDEISIRNIGSIAVSAEEQAFEMQPQSLLTIRPAVVALNPIESQESLTDGAPTISVISENHIARGAVTKIASPRTTETTETLTTIANVVQDSVGIPVIKSMSDLPAAASPLIAIANAPASTIDTILDRQLDLVRNERWLGELAQDIASTSDNKDRLSFRLMPHQLGRLDIDVSRSHTGISLTIRTESDSAQSILTAAQPRLADELRAQGVRLADTQMFSSDARHSQHHGGAARPVSLIENFITPTDASDAPEQVQRDGRYA